MADRLVAWASSLSVVGSLRVADSRSGRHTRPRGSAEGGKPQARRLPGPVWGPRSLSHLEGSPAMNVTGLARERGPERLGKDGDAVAHDPAAGPEGPPGQGSEEQDAGAQGEPAAPRRVHARLYNDAQEAEFRPAQGRQSPADQPDRGHRLHPWCRAQPPGALDRAGARRPGA